MTASHASIGNREAEFFRILFCSETSEPSACRHLSCWFAFALSWLVGTCHAAEANAPARPAVTTWSVPIELRRGRVMMPARINDSQPLSFLLDTGYGISMIHPDEIEPLRLRRAGSVTIVGIAGEEKAGMYSGAVFDIGGARYSPRRVASLPSEARRRRTRDGILGAEFFRRFVVEMDATSATLRLHEPKTFAYEGKGEILPLEFPKDTPVVMASVVGPDGEPAEGRFEIDTGCDGGVCLGSPFIAANHLLGDGDTARPGVRQGVGGGARVRHGSVAQLQLGKAKIDRVPASFFLDGSPVNETEAGHIGMAALSRFKVIFDYSRKRMILEPATRRND